MSHCCELGAKLDEGQVLYQTDNCFVAPALGPIGVPYLLVMTKDCGSPLGGRNGIGSMVNGLMDEFVAVHGLTRRVMESFYGTPVIGFEHGPHCGDLHGGGCLDHAHLHLVATDDIVDEIETYLLEHKSPGDTLGVYMPETPRVTYHCLRDILLEPETSSLYAESSDGQQHVYRVTFSIPSQFCRQLIAKQRGCPDDYDWALSEGRDKMQQTYDELVGRF
ncbi:hypothetical protein AUJ68_05135 [Candidatus Woesearchaeota archaeon CG1_02_57_44]|nr:MAG: hypothetical protein AUJ68_05135 [Candidatus Woesearchaeota archaeon CG1_02_57_44]